MSIFSRFVLPGILTVLLPVSILAQQEGFWSRIPLTSVSSDVLADKPNPQVYKFFRLNESAFKGRVELAPSENRSAARESSFILAFPYTGDQLTRFRVVEAPVMNPALSAKYPGIQSYAGVSIDDQGVSIRFDISPMGFHGMILSPGKATVYIDPVGARGDQLYQVFSRTDVADFRSSFKCFTEDKIVTTNGAGSTQKGASANDGKLRKYRLALCATGSFSQFWLNGTETTDAQRKAKVLAAQNTYMTRANAIFERELSIRLELVANNDAIIYLDATTDPWGDLNSATQTTCDGVIGSTNYDIGHVINRGTDDGNAGCIACVCKPGQKGSAYTSYQNLGSTDFVVVDYLTHEMGHQLGASHSFSFQSEGSGTQMEPGSGSTIMGYAGITGSTDVQAHSDDYYHAVSIDQISNYLMTGAGSSCAVISNTGNTAPAANAGADFIIPRSTPFQLTGVGSDANTTDVLSYTWEQMDSWTTGSSPNGIPASAATTGPLFRSIKPGGSPIRVFPALASILSGTNGNTWERLPSVARSMNFRFTVRDNAAAGGNNNADDMIVTTAANSGPFTVTAPNTAVVWEAGVSQTVTWDVAGSDQAPVNCTAVNILLSTDGGNSFPITLIANTPNDGSQSVTLPAIFNTTSRIKVEAAGNIFFDISNTNFSIIAAQPSFTFTPAAPLAVTCGSATAASLTLQTNSILGYSTPITLSASGAPAGTSVSFSPASVVPGAATVVTLINANTLPSGGSYTISVTGVSGTITRVQPIIFNIQPGAGPVISVQPSSQKICENAPVTFSVTTFSPVASYQWQLSTDGGNNFVNIVGATSSVYSIPAVTLNQNNQQFRVVLTGQCNITTSVAVTLTVYKLPTVTLSATRAGLYPGQTSTLTATITPGAGSPVTANWFYNNTPLGAVPNNTLAINITGLGEYRVQVSDGFGCSNQSNTLAITAVASEQLFIFPSPNNGQFTVSYYNSSSQNSKQTIVVYDTKGAQVYYNTLPLNGSYTLHAIDLRGKAKGIYYVVVGDSAGNKLAEGKVLIQ